MRDSPRTKPLALRAKAISAISSSSGHVHARLLKRHKCSVPSYVQLWCPVGLSALQPPPSWVCDDGEIDEAGVPRAMDLSGTSGHLADSIREVVESHAFHERIRVEG